MTKLLLVRHATNDTVGKTLAGRMPGIHLNHEGQAQAQALAQRLGALAIAAVYSSPMERTLETARPLAEALGVHVSTSDDFLEINYGNWTAKGFTDLADDPQFQRFNTFRSHTRVPDGELMVQAQLRMILGIEKLCEQHPQHAVAIVSHADIIKAALAYYAGIPLDLFQRLEVSPASVSVLEINAYEARILLLNHTGELKI